MVAKVKPLVVVLGSTASGKSDLAMMLAKRFNGEIICADSQAIYRGMDIGTAKPSREDRALVKHHLLDIRNPDESYSVAQFQQDAQEAIAGINTRGKLPIMVGGSGLYIDSVIYNYSFISDGQRDDVNPRHLAKNVGPTNKELREDTLIIGIQRNPEELEARIVERTDGMVEAGLVGEVKNLVTKYGRDAMGLSNIRYQIFADYLAGLIGLDEAMQKFVRNDMLLSKKQKTWFKRNKSIQWVSNSSKAVEITTTFLNNY
ncbi:MAG TPA: tRNA (adenosine(37)-N6)-dimethylallyltransferase MiaA [Candidatus Saccharibacteria bacterium]|nr:tRNA (adenosine(37)-N6)-dimethylallyltransferase MiaA [Candidatus Saccharibacteria bacterium]